MKIACPYCSVILETDPKYSSLEASCPQCGNGFLVPGTPLDQHTVQSQPASYGSSGKAGNGSARRSRNLLLVGLALGLAMLLVIVGGIVLGGAPKENHESSAPPDVVAPLVGEQGRGSDENHQDSEPSPIADSEQTSEPVVFLAADPLSMRPKWTIGSSFTFRTEVVNTSAGEKGGKPFSTMTLTADTSATVKRHKDAGNKLVSLKHQHWTVSGQIFGQEIALDSENSGNLIPPNSVLQASGSTTERNALNQEWQDMQNTMQNTMDQEIGILYDAEDRFIGILGEENKQDSNGGAMGMEQLGMIGNPFLQLTDPLHLLPEQPVRPGQSWKREEKKPSNDKKAEVTMKIETTYDRLQDSPPNQRARISSVGNFDFVYFSPLGEDPSLHSSPLAGAQFKGTILYNPRLKMIEESKRTVTTVIVMVAGMELVQTQTGVSRLMSAEIQPDSASEDKCIIAFEPSKEPEFKLDHDVTDGNNDSKEKPLKAPRKKTTAPDKIMAETDKPLKAPTKKTTNPGKIIAEIISIEQAASKSGKKPLLSSKLDLISRMAKATELINRNNNFNAKDSRSAVVIPASSTYINRAQLIERFGEPDEIGTSDLGSGRLEFLRYGWLVFRLNNTGEIRELSLENRYVGGGGESKPPKVSNSHIRTKLRSAIVRSIPTSDERKSGGDAGRSSEDAPGTVEFLSLFQESKAVTLPEAVDHYNATDCKSSVTLLLHKRVPGDWNYKSIRGAFGPFHSTQRGEIILRGKRVPLTWYVYNDIELGVSQRRLGVIRLGNRNPAASGDRK